MQSLHRLRVERRLGGCVPADCAGSFAVRKKKASEATLIAQPTQSRSERYGWSLRARPELRTCPTRHRAGSLRALQVREKFTDCGSMRNSSELDSSLPGVRFSGPSDSIYESGVFVRGGIPLCETLIGITSIPARHHTLAVTPLGERSTF
jgi:hypothetical protein